MPYSFLRRTWLLASVCLAGSIVGGSLITTALYKIVPETPPGFGLPVGIILLLCLQLVFDGIIYSNRHFVFAMAVTQLVGCLAFYILASGAQTFDIPSLGSLICTLLTGLLLLNIFGIDPIRLTIHAFTGLILSMGVPAILALLR